MSRVTVFLWCLAVLVIAVGLSGCKDGDDDAKLSPDEAKIKKALAQLSDADRAAAEKQRTCPVTENRLGLMGTPLKITVKDSGGKEQEVFICCAGCEESIKGDPDKYLEKLK